MQQITTKGTSIFWLASEQCYHVALLEVLKMPQGCKSLSGHYNGNGAEITISAQQ
jgi:hypothetical protein